MRGSHRTYSTHTIAAITSGRLLNTSGQDCNIRYLLTDSRRLTFPEASCFFALKTTRNDGHRYIPDLINRGVRCFVISNADGLPLQDESIHLILVQDTLHALQQLAAFHRSQFKIPVIGITGSNGKTIVKEWLAQLLMNHKKLVRNPQSFNSQIGVPLSVWQIEDQDELAIFEAGISQPDEMARLHEIIKPDIGIFTNIGPAHDSGFKDRTRKIDEKLKLFQTADVLVFCDDHPAIRERIHATSITKQMTLLSWGKNEGNMLTIVDKVQHHGKTRLSARIEGNVFTIEIPFIDGASIENALHCWTVCSYLGIPQQDIATAMAVLSPVAMRLELREGVNHSTLINDYYNSDLHSFSVALDFLHQQQQHSGKVVILSDILESGEDEKTLYTSIARMLEIKPVDRLVCVGPALMRNAPLFQFQNVSCHPDTESLLKWLHGNGFSDSTILLKGARSFGFERISALLQQKAHETVLEVRLNSLINNINYYRSLLSPGTKLMMMVKAFSYGSGSFEVAGAMQFHHVDYLAVAYADEGVELRKAGISLPIMVMSPEAESFPAMLKYDLEPEIFSFRALHQLEASLSQSAQKWHPVNIHLKIETGMRRLGFEMDDIPELIRRIEGNPQLHVQTVFSHLAASDKPAHDDFTYEQIRRFETACSQLQEGLGNFDRHILNSSGISRFPQAQYEMVRLGIGAYGVATSAESKHLENVLSLKSTITQIKRVAKGESVGYNRSSHVECDSMIGVVPIGYADGLPRALSNGKAALFVNGQRAPIIGDVCMDMCMINLTGIKASEGDEVIIFDQDHSVNRLASAAETIPYELLTRISRRVKRVYIQE